MQSKHPDHLLDKDDDADGRDEALEQGSREDDIEEAHPEEAEREGDDPDLRYESVSQGSWSRTTLPDTHLEPNRCSDVDSDRHLFCSEDGDVPMSMLAHVVGPDLVDGIPNEQAERSLGADRQLVAGSEECVNDCWNHSAVETRDRCTKEGARRSQLRMADKAGREWFLNSRVRWASAEA